MSVVIRWGVCHVKVSDKSLRTEWPCGWSQLVCVETISVDTSKILALDWLYAWDQKPIIYIRLLWLQSGPNSSGRWFSLSNSLCLLVRCVHLSTCIHIPFWFWQLLSLSSWIWIDLQSQCSVFMHLSALSTAAAANLVPSFEMKERVRLILALIFANRRLKLVPALLLSGHNNDLVRFKFWMYVVSI